MSAWRPPHARALGLWLLTGRLAGGHAIKHAIAAIAVYAVVLHLGCAL